MALAIVMQATEATVCQECVALQSFCCPDPWFHKATACCPDCESIEDIRIEHYNDCALRALSRLAIIAAPNSVGEYIIAAPNRLAIIAEHLNSLREYIYIYYFTCWKIKVQKMPPHKAHGPPPKNLSFQKRF